MRITTRQQEVKGYQILTAVEKQEMYEDYLVSGKPLKYYAERYSVNEKTISVIISKMMATKQK